jgi:hypothetical protein
MDLFCSGQLKNWSLILLNAEIGQTSVPSWKKGTSYLLHFVGPSHVRITSNRRVSGEKCQLGISIVNVSWGYLLSMSVGDVYCQWSFLQFSLHFLSFRIGSCKMHAM